MRGYTVLLPLVKLHYPLLPTAVHGTVRHPTAGRGRDPAAPGDLHGRDIQPPWRAWDADLQRPVALNGAASFRSHCGSSLKSTYEGSSPDQIRPHRGVRADVIVEGDPRATKGR